MDFFLFSESNPRGFAVYKNSVGHCFLGKAVQSGTEREALGRQAKSMRSRRSTPSAPARKTTKFDRILSFFSYIRLAASDMRKRVIFASQVICASRVEDYKANIISL